MNKIIIKYTVIAALIVISACSSSKNVTLHTTRPAEITFPSSVETLVLVDRTVYDDNTLSVIEGIITGELPDEDNFGTQELINGIRSQIRQSSRFNIRVAEEKLKGNSLTSVFPEPITWRVINALCKKYKAQSVVAVELFDTDFIITDGVRKVKKKKKVNGKKREVEVNEFYVKGIADVTIGIRVYEPKSKRIFDQEIISRTKTWEEKGNSIQDALSHLIAKNKATGYLSQRIGENYAYKIAPMPITITRSFESESDDTPELAIGARHADVGNWEEAISVWESGISRAPVEDAGYLTYNMAVGYEVLGDFDNAIMWAEKSYVSYENDDALRYVNLLRSRIDDEEQVRIQLNSP
ncbi:MAG: DUF6340 family protein [Bacteroidota bacterium]